MPRNYGLPKEPCRVPMPPVPSAEHRDDPVWPICLILGAVGLACVVGIFVA